LLPVLGLSSTHAMPQDTSYHDYILTDCLGHLPGISSRAMFGGWGIYQDGVIFGLIAEEQLYFKAGEHNRSDFEQYGSQPFIYEAKNHQRTNMGYSSVPEEILSDPELIRDWVTKAVQVSLSKRK